MPTAQDFAHHDPAVPVLTESVSITTQDDVPVLTQPVSTPPETEWPVLAEARWRQLADEVREDVLRELGLGVVPGPFAEIDDRAQRIADRVAAEIGAMLHTEIERLLRERVAEAVALAVANARKRA